MTTTKKRPAPCTPHGVRHRDGTEAALACAALTAPGATTPDGHPLVTVTPEHLLDMDERGLSLVRVVLAPGHHVVNVSDGTWGEVIVDAADLYSMAATYGGHQRAADLLTAELRLEQLAGYDHTDAIPGRPAGRHAA